MMKLLVFFLLVALVATVASQRRNREGVLAFRQIGGFGAGQGAGIGQGHGSWVPTGR